MHLGPFCHWPVFGWWGQRSEGSKLLSCLSEMAVLVIFVHNLEKSISSFLESLLFFLHGLTCILNFLSLTNIFTPPQKKLLCCLPMLKELLKRFTYSSLSSFSLLLTHTGVQALMAVLHMPVSPDKMSLQSIEDLFSNHCFNEGVVT